MSNATCPMCKRVVVFDPEGRLIEHVISPLLRQLCIASKATLADANEMRRQTDADAKEQA